MLFSPRPRDQKIAGWNVCASTVNGKFAFDHGEANSESHAEVFGAMQYASQ